MTEARDDIFNLRVLEPRPKSNGGRSASGAPEF